MHVPDLGQPGEPISIPRPLLLHSAVTSLARLAVGGVSRWANRSNPGYSDDKVIARVSLWYNWAQGRLKKSLVEYDPRPNEKEKEELYIWFIEKYRTLHKASVSGKILPIDVADQVMEIDVDMLIVHQLRPDVELSDTAGERASYVKKAVELWQARREWSDDLYQRRDKAPDWPGASLRAHTYYFAGTLADHTPHECKDWAENIAAMISWAHKVLATVAEKESRDILLERLTEAMEACILMGLQSNGNGAAKARKIAAAWPARYILHRVIGVNPVYDFRQVMRLGRVEPCQPDWLDAGTYRKHVLPPLFELTQLQKAPFTEAANLSNVAQLGLRAQYRYGINLGDWCKRWDVPMV